jgi:glucose/arabinose dehydrogenase
MRPFRVRLAPAVAGLLLFASAQAAAQLPSIQSTTFVGGLSSPVGMVQDPSDPAVQFVVQQGGLIRVIRNGVLQGTNFLNLTSSISTGGERGLLGLAFPGDYARTGRFYVNFTRSGDSATVVARFLRSAGNPLVADPSSRFDLLWPAMPDTVTAPATRNCANFQSTPQRAICQPFDNHNGGKIAFGPDGYLYIGMGDGGSGGDPQNQAQRPATLLGKMLRIDVSVPDGDTRGYRIPPDNPFAGTSPFAVSTLDEIWSFGLRNPWRFTFDPTWLGGTGAMLIGDVGQNAFEEIDYEPARLGGRNYGWSLREAAHDYNAGTTPAFTPLVEPIFEYGNAFGSGSSRSITGGYVYRGTALGAAFRGRYFYADFISGRIASIALTVDPVTREATAGDFQDHTAAFDSPGNISSIDIDGNGEIYVVMWGGEIRRLLPVTADTDGDGISTELELRYGLDPDSGGGANGAAGDPDGDGVTNAAEIAAGTHPRGFGSFTRQLAEGASSSFFETSVSLMNPNSQPARVVLRFLKDTATTVTWPVTIAPRRRLTINPGQLASVNSSSFATIVESDQEVVVERTMTWDQSNYGAHTEKAIAGPASNWFFAEGSQGFFLSYVLLTNPSTSQNRASVRFLRENGGPIVQEFTLAPLSRRTIDCGAIASLANASFGIEVTFLDAPGAAERAMYFGLPPDRLFKAGHESAGVTAPSTEWFLAEGATGGFFETFVLIANPNSAAADVTVTYLTETGQTVTRSKTVPANARLTVNIEAEGSTTLANAAVATRVLANIPVVVERAQYWPNAPSQWYEAHNAFGVTTAGTRWGLAEGQTGRFETASSYILLANNTNTSATVTIDFIREVDIPLTRTFTVPGNSRFNVSTGPSTTVPELDSERFGAVVTSTVPIVVERALYWNANAEFWSAGTNATATALLP